MNIRRLIVTILFLTLLLLLAVSQAFAFFEGQVFHLGKLDESHTVVSAADINERNQVVGTSRDGVQSRAFRWSVKSGMEDLGSLGGVANIAVAINNRGQVAGGSENAEGKQHAFMWTEAEGMIDLGTLGGQTSLAYDVNNRGQVAGISQNAAGHTRAFIWDNRGGMDDIGTLGGDESAAWGINARGQVVGFSCTGGEFTNYGWGPCTAGDRHAFVWSAETGMVDLGVPGAQSDALGINDSGDIVGLFCPTGHVTLNGLCSGGEPYHATLWRSNGIFDDLGSLSDGWSYATDINNKGQIIGQSKPDLAALNSQAFLWSSNHGMAELEVPPAVDVTAASSINNQGIAAGYVRLDSGEFVATLWRTK